MSNKKNEEAPIPELPQRLLRWARPFLHTLEVQFLVDLDAHAEGFMSGVANALALVLDFQCYGDRIRIVFDSYDPDGFAGKWLWSIVGTLGVGVLECELSTCERSDSAAIPVNAPSVFARGEEARRR